VNRLPRSPKGTHKPRLKDERYGYIYVLVPGHPRAGKAGYVVEHLVIAEKALGRFIPEGVIVHHVDEDPGNNDNANLVICQGQAYHMAIHARRRALLACGNADWKKCPMCKDYDDPRRMVSVDGRGDRGGFCHLECRNRAQRIRRWRKKGFIS